MEKKIPPLSSPLLDGLLVSIDAIKPHPLNYKQHPEDQLNSLIASLETFGWTKAICADTNGFIVAGHGMYYAALKKGYNYVPVQYLPFTENQSKAYLVADNETQRKGRTDHNQLKDLLGDISLMPDIDIAATGFSAQEVDMFINIDDNFSFDAPEPTEPAEGREYTESEGDYSEEGSFDSGDPDDMVEVEGDRQGMSYAVHISFSMQEQAEAFLAKIGAKTRAFIPGKMSTMINGDELEL